MDTERKEETAQSVSQSASYVVHYCISFVLGRLRSILRHCIVPFLDVAMLVLSLFWHLACIPRCTYICM